MTLSQEPVGAADIKEYLEGVSDFAFEMEVLSELERLGFTCEHGGTYTDPVTGKARQFDIRARKSQGRACLVLCAECKNIRDFYPLVVHRVPRRPEEAFHTVIQFEPIPGSGLPLMTDVRAVTQAEALYPQDAPVGKRIDQVGRAQGKTNQGGRAQGQSGEIVSSDRDVFEKVAQAIASAHDISRSLARERTRADYVVLPVTVIPDGRLWVADYEPGGRRIGDPREEPGAQLFVGQSWSLEPVYGEFKLSHLEIATFSHLATLVETRAALSSTAVFPSPPPQR